MQNGVDYIYHIYVIDSLWVFPWCFFSNHKMKKMAPLDEGNIFFR